MSFDILLFSGEAKKEPPLIYFFAKGVMADSFESWYIKYVIVFLGISRGFPIPHFVAPTPCNSLHFRRSITWSSRLVEIQTLMMMMMI